MRRGRRSSRPRWAATRARAGRLVDEDEQRFVEAAAGDVPGVDGVLRRRAGRRGRERAARTLVVMRPGTACWREPSPPMSHSRSMNRGRWSQDRWRRSCGGGRRWRSGRRRVPAMDRGRGRRRVDRRTDLVVFLGDADEGHRGVAGDQLHFERLTLVEAGFQEPVDHRVGGVGHRGDPCRDALHVHHGYGASLRGAGSSRDRPRRP